MFDALTARLTPVLDRLRGRGVLNEGNVSEALREVRRALLEADVHVGVARSFIETVKSRALGGEVSRGVSPGQQMIRIIHDELVELLGGDDESREIALDSRGPARVLVLGLQGSGKTTLCCKLALRYGTPDRRAALLGLDPYRPAAGEQLKLLAERIEVPVRVAEPDTDPVTEGIRLCGELEADGAALVLIDTAGRQTVNEELMRELSVLHEALDPAETMLVLDALTGQDAVQTARAFADRIPCTGAVLSKLDGDARGGAAISLRAVTGLPILYVGVGEGLDRLEPFRPDRMAARILGMGDVVSLVEKAAEKAGSTEVLAEEGRKFIEGDFTLDDLRAQLNRLRAMGPIQSLAGMLPSKLGGILTGAEVDESSLVAMEAIIDSMTLEERRRPSIIDGSRRRRIARGSGRSVQEVNNILKQYATMQKIAKSMKRRF